MRRAERGGAAGGGDGGAAGGRRPPPEPEAAAARGAGGGEGGGAEGLQPHAPSDRVRLKGAEGAALAVGVEGGRAARQERTAVEACAVLDAPRDEDPSARGGAEAAPQREEPLRLRLPPQRTRARILRPRRHRPPAERGLRHAVRHL